MNLGLLAAVAAAMLYSLAAVVQKSQAEAVAGTGMAILEPLMTRPLWLLGVALQVLGFGLHSFALTEAPVMLVQPIIASGVGFLVIFAALVLGERPTAREIAGMAMTAGGVSLLALQIDHPDAMRPVAAQDLGFALASAAVVAAALLGAGGSSRIGSNGARAALIGASAGMGQGMSDAMNRLAGAWLSPQTGWVPPAWIGWLAVVFLLLFGLQGFVAAQNAFQRYRANTVVPCMMTAELIVPIAVAVALYGQSLPHGGVGLGGWSVALLLTCAGVVSLSRAEGIERTFATRMVD